MKKDVADAFNHNWEFMVFVTCGLTGLAAQHVLEGQELETMDTADPRAFLKRVSKEILKLVWQDPVPIISEVLDAELDEKFDFCFCGEGITICCKAR